MITMIIKISNNLKLNKMKRSNINVKQFLKSFLTSFVVLPFFILFFMASCEKIKDMNMKNEIDISHLAPEPKLSVSAILEGGRNFFSIRILDDWLIPIPDQYNLSNVEIIREGEIRLYEDDELIHTVSGPFDMSRDINFWNYMVSMGRNGYHYFAQVVTRPGGVYRLEVEVEGYPLAVSTSVMPEPIDVSVNIDTSEYVAMMNVKSVPVHGYEMFNEPHPVRYWPVSVNVNNGGDNKYLSFEISRNFSTSGIWALRIGKSDASFFYEGIDLEMMSSRNTDLYVTPSMMIKDFKDSEFNFYVETVEIPKYDERDDDPDFEKITISSNFLTMYVKNITPVSYWYNHNFTLQYRQSKIFSTQPIIVEGNIENGFGCFSVQHSTIIRVLDWETYTYRRKEQ